MGFPGLHCIKCHEADMVSLDLDDCKTFRCRQCDDEFTADDVREHVNQWQAVLRWLESPVTAGKVGA